jgi:hypothetical protein
VRGDYGSESIVRGEFTAQFRHPQHVDQVFDLVPLKACSLLAVCAYPVGRVGTSSKPSGAASAWVSAVAAARCAVAVRTRPIPPLSAVLILDD